MIKLYTIDCPKCLILEKKLNQKNIFYIISRDREEMASKGYNILPILEIEGEPYDFKQAVNWINSQR